jgi:hypothetical protein
VLPQRRRRGYATEILRHALVIARANGVDRALLICDDENIGSAAVIEACGGRLDSIVRTGPGADRQAPVLDRLTSAAAAPLPAVHDVGGTAPAPGDPRSLRMTSENSMRRSCHRTLSFQPAVRGSG